MLAEVSSGCWLAGSVKPWYLSVSSFSSLCAHHYRLVGKNRATIQQYLGVESGSASGFAERVALKVLDAGPGWPRGVEQTKLPTPLFAETSGQRNDKDPYLGRVPSS